MSNEQLSNEPIRSSTNEGAQDRPVTRLGPVTFSEFPHPQLSTSGSAHTTELEVLPESEDDDAATVVQSFGLGSRSFTLRGTTYIENANALDGLVGEELSIRHARFSGRVLVSDVDTDPTGSKDENGWRYTYRCDLTEVR